MQFLSKGQNEITTLEAIHTLEKMGIQSEEKKLFKIKGDLLTELRLKKTKFELKKKQFDTDDKAEAKSNYHELLASYGSILGYQLKENMKLTEWCGIIKSIKAKNEATKQISKKYGSTRK